MSTLASAGAVRTTEPPSLLTGDPEKAAGQPLDPDARRDLLIDQLVKRLTEGRPGYQLDDWFTTLVPADDVAYRHEVFTDLQCPTFREGLTAFSSGMQHARRILAMAAKLQYEWERRRWFLQVARDYVATVRGLAGSLGAARLRSAALQGLASWVDGYVASAHFEALAAEAELSL